MSLSDEMRVAKIASIVALMLGACIISGCQVRPLYGNPEVVSALNTVGISEPTNRNEQSVRNQLVFLLSGGAGEPANPAYNLELHVTSAASSYVAQIVTNAPRPGKVTLTANYILTRGGAVVRKGSRTMDALFDYPEQQFARIRAQREAEDRAARELAELVRIDIATSIGK
jgi:LPS-assembly lipoprotein